MIVIVYCQMESRIETAKPLIIESQLALPTQHLQTWMTKTHLLQQAMHFYVQVGTHGSLHQK